MSQYENLLIDTARELGNEKNSIVRALHSTKRKLTAAFNDQKRVDDEEKEMIITSVSDLVARYDRVLQTRAALRQKRREDKKKRAAESARLEPPTQIEKVESKEARADRLFHDMETQIAQLFDHQRHENVAMVGRLKQELAEREKKMSRAQQQQLSETISLRESSSLILSLSDQIERLAFEKSVFQTDFKKMVSEPESLEFQKILRAASNEFPLCAKAALAGAASLASSQEKSVHELKEKLQHTKSQNEVELVAFEVAVKQLEAESETLRQFIIGTHHDAVSKIQDYEQAEAARREKANARLGLKSIGKVFMAPVKNVVQSVSNAMHHEEVVSAEMRKTEQRISEKIKDQRKRCSEYTTQLRDAVDVVLSDVAWLQQQQELVRALIQGDDIPPATLAARTIEILHRPNPV